MKSDELTLPRLQFRWSANPDRGDCEWLCHYEMVIPLREFDVRREVYDEDGEQVGEISELVVSMGPPTKRGSNHVPCTSRNGGSEYDEPYRDGRHAEWDSACLGGLPIFSIGIDGKAVKKPSPPTQDTTP